MMESTDSSSGSQQPQLPPGFRFHPTDEELVVHYLKKKASSSPLPVPIIADVDLYKFDPWELPGKASFGDQEWYFFSPRDRKYPNGARPNRAATSGYWKATGTDKPILTSGGTQKIGVKKALVFYGGKPPKGIKTNWIMHEYRLLSSDKSNIRNNNNNNNTNASSSNSSSRPLPPIINKKNSLRLDDWVLCRIYRKCNSQRISMEHQQDCRRNMELQIAKNTNSDLLLENNENFFEGLLTDQGLNSNNNDNSATTSNTNTTDLLSLRRSLQASSYWINEEGKPSHNDQSSSEKFRANLNSSSSTESGNNSAVNFLANQIPQASNSSFHQHLLFGSLGDGTVDLRQPYQITGINWGS